MATNNYPCSQLELYAVCRIGWANYSRQQASFGIFRPIYSVNYGLQRVAEIAAAEQLPDDQRRDAASEAARVNLEAAANTCLHNWQMLKRYIIAAFSPALQKSMLESAGSNYYDAAANQNWDVLNGLNVDGSAFIAANAVVLGNNQNMPAFFAGNFNNAKALFDTNYGLFKQAEEVATSQTDTKITANNNLYSKLISMFLDAQEVLRTNPGLLQQFVFDTVLGLVTSPGTAGLRGVITTGAGNTPLADVTVTIVELAKTVQSAIDGSYDFSRIRSGDFTVRFEKIGFVSVVLNAFRIPTGTTVTHDVVMSVV